MPINVFPDVAPIATSFDAVLLDAYGVFWGGNAIGLLPYAKEAMEALVSSKKTVGILSNTTQLAFKEIDKLKAHGIIQGKHFHFLLTSGEIAKQFFLQEELPFETPRKKFSLFGGVHPKHSSHTDIFQGSCYRESASVEDADFVYISIPHIDGEDQQNPDLFRKEVEKIREKNLPMICPNPDKFAHEGNPARAVVRQGSIAALYEELGGSVFYIGKPNSRAFLSAMDRFQKHGIFCPSQILMVGDTPETDIRGAKRFGISSALILNCGIMADRISYKGLEGAIEALPSQDAPDYFIGRL